MDLSSFPEELYALVIGFHPPWNWGEAVVTRNIFLIMKKYLSINLNVYSNIDANRDTGERLADITYINTFNETTFAIRASIKIMKSLLDKTAKNKILIHTVGVNEAILWKMWIFFKKLNVVHNQLHLIVHDYGPVPPKVEIIPYRTRILLKTKMFNILTTSLITSKMYSDNKRVFYVPAPYIPASEIESYTTYRCFEGCKFLKQIITDLKDKHILLYIGPLRKERFNYTLIMPTLKKLISMGHKDVVLLIISPKYSKNYNGYKSSLFITKLATSLQLARHVYIIVGNICENCKEKLLKNSKIFLFLPLNERQSMDPPFSVIEAMANGNVVITSKYLSLPYMIKPGYNGFLLVNPNVECLASVISKLLSDKNYFQHLSENAINYIRDNHSYSIVIKYLDNLYKNIID
ncbi:MAG: glycosyltransferase [Thermosphaera sp.]